MKSQNILLRASGPLEHRAVITDFGVARWVEAPSGVTLDGHIVGTPTHMAPEQLLGEPVSPATDIFALGVVLFEMVSGRLPFEGRNNFETARLRLDVPAPRLTRVAPHVDPRLSHVVARCLERDPVRRYANAAEIIEALRSPAPTTLPAALGSARRSPQPRGRALFLCA